MIEILFSAVLPVFAAIAIGYVAGLARWFDAAEATTLNRYVFFIALPVLGFRLLGRADLVAFDWSVLGAYVGVEAVIYALGYAMARRLFARGVRESLLIGLACTFVNHVFFILPIAGALIGEAASQPIVGVITVDSVLLYAGTMLALEVIGEGGGSAALGRVARNFLGNPQIIAIAAGIAVSLAGLSFAPGIELFTGFIANSAAPVSLFALGVILSRLKGGEGHGPAAAITVCKLLIHPALMAVLLFFLLDVTPQWQAPVLLVAAGPVGAMPFVMAIQYKVPFEAVARALVWSTLGSLVTVSFVASLAVAM
ncbi:MAG: AEC family transporter [Alphaproteobacteria bacterium]